MYKVIFEDDEVFESCSEDSKWNEMPEKKIKKLIYSFGKDNIIFEGFEAYNHLIEKVQFIMGRSGNITTKVILMGKYKEEIHQLVIDLHKEKVYKLITPVNKEYMEKTTIGWKEGVSSQKPTIKLDK
jgi:hypothetical protein